MKLLIVETPAQAKTLASILGQGWQIEVVRGWARDLPHDRLGVDISHDFALTRTPQMGTRHRLERLARQLRDAETVYVGLWGDDERVAAVWDWLEAAGCPPETSVFGVVFSALAPPEVAAALESPRPLDPHWLEAALARRTVARLIGYLLAPLAAKALKTSVSIEWMEVVFLHYLMERAQKPASAAVESRYQLRVQLASGQHLFTAELKRVKEQTAPFALRLGLEKLAALLQRSACWVEAVTTGMEVVLPPAPFSTLDLLQVAGHQFGLSPQRTLAVAEGLYEAGWITSPWTPTATVSPRAATAAQALIRRAYGDTYVGQTPCTETPPEAIRPTDETRLPEAGEGDGRALYRLIWKRFIGAHLPPARYRRVQVQIRAGASLEQPYPIELAWTSQLLAFDGFLHLDEASLPTAAEALILPREGEALRAIDVQIVEDGSPPSGVCTAADLVTAVCQAGAAKPQTALTALDRLKANDWLLAAGGGLTVTALGEQILAFLQTHFPFLTLMESLVGFESAVEQIERGQMTREAVVSAFWATFQPALKTAAGTLLRDVHVTTARRAAPVILRPAREGEG